MTEERKNQKQKDSELKTYTIPFFLGEIKESIINTPGSTFNLNKEQILVKANKFYLQGNLSEAKRYYKYLLASGFTNPVILSNYGSILGNQGELKEAEQSLREAIKLKPDFAQAYYNLGTILSKLGRIKEANITKRIAIKFDPIFKSLKSIQANAEIIDKVAFYVPTYILYNH